MRVLTTAVWTQLHTLISRGVALWLVSIEVDQSPPLPRAFHLVANTRSVALGGRSYRPWPITIDEIPEAGRGDLEECSLTIANIHRLTMPFLESGAWDQGRVEMIFALRHPDTGVISDSGIRFNWRMQSATSTDDRVTLALGQPNYLEVPFPWERFIRGDKFPAIPRNQ